MVVLSWLLGHENHLVFYFEDLCSGSWDSVPILVSYTLVCCASATSCWHLESSCCRLHSTLLVLARWLGCLLAGFAVSVMLSDSASLSRCAGLVC